ncbi:transcription initiation factor IIA, gamma subunit [Eremomyces bilateralis CBS 781.70]|uniref:Transcription initiation factor IIA subunit 2 n=1 Tax=Eremomyces bilateralis CBS 781.70 TaxID=1392243 RepID=A0A6G1FXJ9_9PEZI|nr:transcription initiation factor IIA, gamma subunit [Eremomyces bilateralis CBS 781.70]KAF1810513.1 transcription initiation factor IIA, gamma subunit [Eremomyces bilateralis CBS 781.70]
MAAQPKNENFYELYRVSSIGTTLADTIDDMITLNKLEPQIAMRLLATFDRVIADVLSSQVKSRMSFKGNLDTYRFCDEVWTFVLKDVKFKMDNQSPLEASRIKIVSMNSKPGGT